MLTKKLLLAVSVLAPAFGLACSSDSSPPATAADEADAGSQEADGSTDPGPSADSGTPSSPDGATPPGTPPAPGPGAGTPTPLPTGPRFYVDPVKGSPSGDGSAAKPWRTLKEVVEAGLVESHDENGGVVNAGKPVKAGSVIVLRDGYHGDVRIDGWNNSDFIAIVAEDGQKPKLSKFGLYGSSK